MEKMCLSCGAPLAQIGANVKNDTLCQYCGDENGNLVPKEAAIAGMAEWLKSWAPITEGVDFRERAISYMSAMPAWN
ncbi:MAG: hypothetical protein JXR64_04210 [Spirochaetales bacterium]|nr:hypothetical protein [Spirochaetales bacterium]